MTGGAAADGAAALQFGSYEFDRLPHPFLVQEMFRLGQQATLQAFGVAFSGPLDRQAADILLIASSRVPGVVARVPGLRSNAAQRDEDFPLQPVLGRLASSLLKFASTQFH